jgi:hypothetical protein
MAGLGPAIHAVMPRSHFLPWEATGATVASKRAAFDPPNRVDGRVEPGHDGGAVYPKIRPLKPVKRGAPAGYARGRIAIDTKILLAPN